MDFNRAEPTCYRTNFPYASFRITKWSLFIHSTTHNAPYVHPRLDSILELCPAFPIELMTVPLGNVSIFFYRKTFLLSVNLTNPYPDTIFVLQMSSAFYICGMNPSALQTRQTIYEH